MTEILSLLVVADRPALCITSIGRKYVRNSRHMRRKPWLLDDAVLQKHYWMPAVLPCAEELP